MIQTLRVVDLHKILQFLNISVAGRKHELQQRIIDLLKSNNFEIIASKLREIYRSSVTDCYPPRNIHYGPPEPKRMFSHMQMPTVQSAPDVRSALVGVGNVGGVGGGNVPGNMGVPFQHAIGASMPIHPDVRLKKLAFYDVLATLIKPSSLLPRTNQRIQEVPFYFTLTPQQATEIATNRDIRNGSKVEHSIQVQLRFCLLETSCEQEDCFPSSVIVKVNNKLCPLPNPIPTNRPNVEPKRPPRPVNVTSNVKLSPTVTNTIIVQWCPDFSRGYCIAAYLVKKLTSSQLLHRMKTKGVKPADYTRALIKEKLTEDADCEIATTMLKVSLNCPLGKMKMSIPCRASTCSHLQCFDANLFLQMNERKPTWNCPVCDKPAIYDNLVIDGYFQEVLASSLLESEDTEIQLHKDGSWSTHNLRNETQLVDTPSKPVEKVEVISDDIELITTDDIKPPAKAPPPPIISNEPTSTTSSETVDLTLSDSDDDLPLAKRKTATVVTGKNAPTSSAVSTSNGQRSTSVQSSHISKGEIMETKLTATGPCTRQQTTPAKVTAPVAKQTTPLSMETPVPKRWDAVQVASRDIVRILARTSNQPQLISVSKQSIETTKKRLSRIVPRPFTTDKTQQNVTLKSKPDAGRRSGKLPFPSDPTKCPRLQSTTSTVREATTVGKQCQQPLTEAMPSTLKTASTSSNTSVPNNNAQRNRKKREQRRRRRARGYPMIPSRESTFPLWSPADGRTNPFRSPGASLPPFTDKPAR